MQLYLNRITSTRPRILEEARKGLRRAGSFQFYSSEHPTFLLSGYSLHY